MIKFLLVRHGNSVANQQEIFAGATDIPLSEIGKKQAQFVCDYILNNFKVDAVYSSELDRAKSTVSQIAEQLNLPLVTIPAFNEIFGGAWEGITFAEIYKKYTVDLLTWLNDISNSKCTNGESFKQLKERAFAGLKTLAEDNKNDGKTLVIASHAGALRAILSVILKLSDKECNELGWVSNASVTTVNYDNGVFTVERLGYDEYLENCKTELPKNI
ncbi:MAG: histidine phosphatase family protein [Clostridia bacterium]|nr:histidine phosphatase family protein [Clostridia bacterium]